MKKLLILFVFSLCLLFGSELRAQCVSYGCFNSNYYYNLGAYTYFWNNASNSMKAAYAIDQSFGALFSSLNLIAEGRALENHINARRNNLENYNSIKRYYTEGIPPFATHGPDGRPRSPEITWSDVQSIE